VTSPVSESAGNVMRIAPDRASMYAFVEGSVEIAGGSGDAGCVEARGGDRSTRGVMRLSGAESSDDVKCRNDESA
jgi:hypothetical protein